MLTLGTAWHGFRYLTAENYFATAAALALSKVEVPLYWHVIEDQRFDLRDRKRLLRLAEDAGVEMHAGVAALDIVEPFDIVGLPITKDAVAFNLAVARRVIDIGEDLGLSVIRLIEPNIDESNLPLADAYLEDHGRALADLGDYAAHRGIKLAAENFGVTSRQMGAILSAADHPSVGTLFDPCNYFRMGEDPIAALDSLGDRIFYCHAKDARIDENRSPDQLYPGSRWKPSVAVGAGDIDWNALIPALAQVYSGVVAIEYEMSGDVVLETRRSRDHLVRLLAGDVPP
jgi:sugar phosphate isomerase/epimerase